MDTSWHISTQSTYLTREQLGQAYRLMYTSATMTEVYEAHKELCNKHVYATARGHEAIQVALGMLLQSQDYVSPYYREDALLIGMGIRPYEVMLPIFAKKADPFSGGRHYYAHPSLNLPDKPFIIHQSSSTGMQAIPTTGIAQGLQYQEEQGLVNYDVDNLPPVVVCSIGDGAVTEGEFAEALQMAALHQYPILYLVQDNGWGISAQAKDMYAQNAVAYASGFKGIETMDIDGTDFHACYYEVGSVIETIRKERRPFLIRAEVPLIHHHTSGVRKEWYRHDLDTHEQRDPVIRLRHYLLREGFGETQLEEWENGIYEQVLEDFHKARTGEDPDPASLSDHVFAPTPITKENGDRSPKGAKEIVMVDAALHAIDQILSKHPEALFYGQDVGGKLGGVFREAATLAEKYGSKRVFNTPIQEAYIIGSTKGMSAVGCKPIVEIQFADYMWPGFNQLYAELSRSYYLSNGKWPVQALIRVPTGAYGGGGPYHSSSIESAVLTIRGIKVVYPSNAADMKGLMNAAFYDPNPVIMFEHKGLYWSKVPGSKGARTAEPSDDYIIPLGKARIYQAAEDESIENGESCLVITYGMGVHWAVNASASYTGQIEILDLRTLEPLDWDAIQSSVKRHNKVLVLTEEPYRNSFAEALAGRISQHLFTYLDAPVQVLGAVDVPAIPLNTNLEEAMLPSPKKVEAKLAELLRY